MDLDQDIWFTMRHLLICIHQNYFLKSIKDNINKNTWNRVSKIKGEETMQGWTY